MATSFVLDKAVQRADGRRDLLGFSDLCCYLFAALSNALRQFTMSCADYRQIRLNEYGDGRVMTATVANLIAKINTTTKGKT